MFQSPCGEVVWESQKLEIDLIRETNVSIPLRGSRLGKAYPEVVDYIDNGDVSIPLRGSRLGKSSVVLHEGATKEEGFNPLAGKSFGKGDTSSFRGWNIGKFQSPCGEVVWESCSGNCFWLCLSTLVSIPLRGSRLGKRRKSSSRVFS